MVGSSNFTLAGFTGNTELNVRVTGDVEMAALRDWFEDLWREARDISQALVAELDRSWALAHTPPLYVARPSDCPGVGTGPGQTVRP